MFNSTDLILIKSVKAFIATTFPELNSAIFFNPLLMISIIVTYGLLTYVRVSPKFKKKSSSYK